MSSALGGPVASHVVACASQANTRPWEVRPAWGGEVVTRQRMAALAVGFRTHAVPTLGRRIQHVRRLVAEEEVVRPDAPRDIAFMEYPKFARVSEVDHPRGAVRFYASATDSEAPVGPACVSRMNRPSPQPALVERDEFNPGHEPLNNFCGKHLKTRIELAFGGQRG